MPRILSNRQVEDYHSRGFVFPVRALTPDEASAATAKVEAFEAEYGCEAQQRLAFKAHLPFRWLNDIMRQPRILDAVEDVIGPDILCWGTAFFQKNARDPRFVSWHQDKFYYGLEPSETCTAWLAFTPSTLESGCVRVLPGTHRSGETYEFVNEPDENNLLVRGQTIKGLKLDRAVPMILDAGEFSLHHEGIVHGSDPNNSDHRRIGLSMHYISPDVRRIGYNEGASRPTASLVRGVDRFGYWEHEPAPVSDEVDVGALATLDRMRAEFFRRSREDRLVDEPARS